MTEHRFSLNALAETLKAGAHSIFSASGSSLWMHCSGGLIPNLLAPDTSGREAAEGTVAHGVGETWLRSRKKPSNLVGTTEGVINGGQLFNIEITIEMLHYVQEYFDWCSWLPGDHFVETKVYYSQITPLERQGGTADHVACTPGRMVITDLKFGKGVQVFAKGNTQALLYALGFFYEYDWWYDFQEIEMRICQPRLNHFDTWTITREELLAFAEHAKVRAYLAWSVNAPRTPGDKQCAFCRVKGDCAAHFYWQASITEGCFENLEEVTVDQVLTLKDNIELKKIGQFTDVFKLTTAEMAKLYHFRPMFEGWWKSLHNELNIRAAAGEVIPGMKMVEGRSKRHIRDEKVAMAVLELDYNIPRSELIEEKMASPAKIETLLRKRGVRSKDLSSVLDPMVRKLSGKPTLVSDADRRTAIVDLSEIAFGDLDLETEDETQED